MNNKIEFIISFLLWGCSFVYAANLPSRFAETRLSEKLDATFVKYSPDGRVFVVQKPGIINILQDGSQIPLVCMDIRDKIDNYDERGAQSMAFDPDFLTNGYFYVYYTVKNASHNRVSRFTMQGNVGDPASELVLIDIDRLDATVHNGGGLFFNEGKLFILTGDGGTVKPQSLESLLGKVIRINPDGTIPTDNPFYGQTTGKYRAIYARGLRNPFSASVNPADGRVFINDVGGNEWEEINILYPGANYGWPAIEGKITNQTRPENYYDPAYAYGHNETSGICAITGSAFYSPTTAVFPSEYVGKYFFGDYCTNTIYILDPDTFTLLDEVFATDVVGVVSCDVSPAGDFYYLARGGVHQNTRAFRGEVYKVMYTNSAAPSFSFQPTNIRTAIGINATFSVGASGDSLAYQWYRDGTVIAGATSRLFTFSGATLADNGALFKVSITNTHGTVESNEATLTVIDSAPPVVTIVSPAEGQKYSAGTMVDFSATAVDAEDGELLDDYFVWKIDFHHADHIHPALDLEGLRGDHYFIPSAHESANDVWYRFYVTVTDHTGVSTTVQRDLMPNLATIILTTSPPGLPIKVDGAERPTPYTFISVVGIRRTIEAFSHSNNGTDYTFQSWSDNGATQHTIVVPTHDETFTAVFSAQNVSNNNNTSNETGGNPSGGTGTNSSNGTPDGSGGNVADGGSSGGAIDVTAGTSENKDDEGLSGGAIAGIVAGSVVFVGAVVGGFFFYKAKFGARVLSGNSPGVATPLP